MTGAVTERMNKPRSTNIFPVGTTPCCTEKEEYTRRSGNSTKTATPKRRKKNRKIEAIVFITTSPHSYYIRDISPLGLTKRRVLHFEQLYTPCFCAVSFA